MKIDLHVHTNERSPCGRTPEHEQIRAAIASGLDAIVLTDHEKLAPTETLVQMNETYAPFRVFGGIEIGINQEHLLVLGINDARLVSEEWSYPELHAFCRDQGGFLVLAHPFRYRVDINLDIERYPPDALEAYSVNTPLEAAGRILDLASRLGIHTLSNSDAHSDDSIGRHYNVLNRQPADEAELIADLRRGEFTPIVE